MDETYKQVTPYLPEAWRQYLNDLPPALLAELEEIRLRPEHPVLLRFHTREGWLNGRGGLSREPEAGCRFSAGDFGKSVLLITDSSYYALAEELRRGYVTLPGGHRAGITGRAVLEKGQVRTLKDLSAVNIRLARHIPGLARPLLPLLADAQGRLCHTLLVAPPRAGKTTMLRDMACLLSSGAMGEALCCGVVDERSELAALRLGVPPLPVGPRSYVLDGCPKAEGLMMLLRSMGPQAVLCDEIGRPEDVAAIAEAAHAGVKVIATAHGAPGEDLARRPALRQLLADKAFGRFVFLSRRLGPGTVETVLDGEMRPVERSRNECA
ncbi:MAG: stage III sporulation protein AA [Firmicutes bacterium]|nr:stage III sporulation protein AA [Bacillota bacterium]